MAKKRNPKHKVPEHNHDAKKSSASSKSTSSETISIPMPKNPWMIATVVLAIVLIIVMSGSGKSGMSAGVTEEEAAQAVIDFASGQGLTATLSSVEMESGLYKVNVEVQGQVVPVYVTTDGKNLVPSVLPIDSLAGQAAPTANEPAAPSTNTVDVDMKTLSDDDAFKGDANAPVTIVEFSDYECGFCARFYRDTLSQLESEYIDTGKVKLVYRDFPLGFHPNAQKAAEAAECAGDQGKYFEMHDLLFEKGASGGVDSFKAYAAELGLNQATFDTCLDSGTHAEEVKKDMADGQAVGVSGTPAFIINGQLVSGAQPFSAFKQIIDAELGM